MTTEAIAALLSTPMRKKTRADARIAIALRREGLTYPQIGRALNVSHEWARCLCLRLTNGRKIGGSKIQRQTLGWARAHVRYLERQVEALKSLRL